MTYFMHSHLPKAAIAKQADQMNLGNVMKPGVPGEKDLHLTRCFRDPKSKLIDKKFYLI